MLTLLHAARDGTNKEAWRRLVGLCAPLLHEWLRCQHLQHADAEDLVQETLLTLAVEAPTFRPHGNPAAFRRWLCKVLANRLLNFRRAERARSIFRLRSELLDRLTDVLIIDSRADLTGRWDDEHNSPAARLRGRKPSGLFGKAFPSFGNAHE
jgi:RNA polymerase sigma factor (sigma-70 family)